MPDRHWMEKWKWDRSKEPAMLVRKKDGKMAGGWTHAAEIEGEERGVTADTMLTNPKYQMVPLSECYPDDVGVEEPIRLGERREEKEAKAFAERMQDLRDAAATPDEEIPWAHKTGPKGTQTRAMFIFGWCFLLIAVMIWLVLGASLMTGIIGLACFTSGAMIAGFILKE